MQVSEYPVAFVVAMGGALSFVALELVGVPRCSLPRE